MFNLIISADEEAWERPSFVLDAERFLEYTDDQLKKRFRVLDEDMKKTLIKLPTLFAYESPISKPARVGSLNSIEKQGRQIRITYSFSPSLEPVDPEREVARARRTAPTGPSLFRSQASVSMRERVTPSSPCA